MMKKVLQGLVKEDIQERLVDNGMSQEEVANMLGITRYQVDKLEKKALRKLKYIVTRTKRKEDFI
jgi:DNA-directed RNA polymerase sigma subunit (sigma70/sigma32)